MGNETKQLIHKRSNYRTYGWLLTLVGGAGILFIAYVGFHTILGSLQRHSFLQSNDFYPLVENGAPTPFLFGLAIAIVVVFGAGNLFLSMARGITKELKATQVEVSRRVRVEESLRERGRAGAH